MFYEHIKIPIFKKYNLQLLLNSNEDIKTIIHGATNSA